MQPSKEDVAKALTSEQLVFGLTVQNIPTINLRQQYVHDRKLAFDDNLTELLHAWRFDQMGRPATRSFPDPDGYFTMLLRSTTVGLECLLKAAAIEELAFTNRLTKPLFHSIRHPSKLSNSMADACYNKIPGLVDAGAALEQRHNDLWQLVRRFYREVRNPLSHGDQLYNVKAESLRAVFGMFDQIYSWIDSWYVPDRIQQIIGASTFRPLK